MEISKPLDEDDVNLPSLVADLATIVQANAAVKQLNYSVDT